MRSFLIGLLLLSLCLPLTVSAQGVEITTVNETPREKGAAKLLEAFMMANNLHRWKFTDKVQIDSRAIPHSHPVLTLHTRHMDKGKADLLLATYLHEQLHWHLHQNEAATDDAIEALRDLFPGVPVGFPEGARDERSTYLHLLVCYLEMDAVSQLLSPQRTQAILDFWKSDHYTWVYQQVEERGDEIEAVIAKFGLQVD